MNPCVLPALSSEVPESVECLLRDCAGVLGAESDKVEVHVVPEGQGDLEVGLAPAPRRTVHLATAAVKGGGNAYVTSAIQMQMWRNA